MLEELNCKYKGNQAIEQSQNDKQYLQP